MSMVSNGGYPEQSDYKKEPQREIHTSSSGFNFCESKNLNNLGETLGLKNKDLNSTKVTLNEFVKLHKTISFLIIRNDSIIYESYDPKYNDTSLVSSFSLIKPMITSLIGIAIRDGKIKSIEDKAITYLPEYSKIEGFAKIKIKHLLHHTSGIKFSDSRYNPFSDNADYYWGGSLRKKLLDISISEAPDLHFRYSSINTMLLARILEVVSQQTISKYLEEKIWKPVGVEGSGYWTLDRSDDNGIEKSFCCFQARVKDFARLGRLHLNYGNWFGKQIVPEEWIRYAIKPDPSGGNKLFYNNN
jgi:CubicO group peptidase (beta-lactamase class C family)